MITNAQDDPFLFDDKEEGFTYVRRAPTLRQLAVGFMHWYINLFTSPIFQVYDYLHKNYVKQYVRPPIEYIWKNKYQFMKYGFVASVYVISTVFTATIMYFIIRSCFTVKEHTTVPLYFNFNNQIPKADIELNYGSIVANQPYSVSVDMELPESPVNVDVGMFMINLRVYGDYEESKPILDVSRPCMLRYKTWVMKMIHTIFYAFPSLMGWYEEKQILEVVLTDYFISPKSLSAAKVVVTVNNENLQIYSSEVNFKAKLSWLSYWFQRWPITSYLVGVVILSFFTGSLLLLCGAALYFYIKSKYSSSSSKTFEFLREETDSDISPPPSSRSSLSSARMIKKQTRRLKTVEENDSDSDEELEIDLDVISEEEDSDEKNSTNSVGSSSNERTSVGSSSNLRFRQYRSSSVSR
eukprot:TRINITY_DN162_c0_g1_i4.p1 TRINITY_DN162_c0_g1~~TRINITY_DN162_c0_g1_i4.p1  ORF type:complete len:432 (-),score=90.57 TRINITY_DN162_c0_g1_i4:68-1297(-)